MNIKPLKRNTLQTEFPERPLPPHPDEAVLSNPDGYKVRIFHNETWWTSELFTLAEAQNLAEITLTKFNKKAAIYAVKGDRIALLEDPARAKKPKPKRKRK